MKEKKKLFIIGGIVLVLILGVTLFLIFKKDDDKKPDTPNEAMVAPANNTEELIKKTEVLKTENVTEDEIVFSSDIDVKENEKVAVWIYSEPKFLGYFEVKVENNVKKIVGLKEALEKIDVDSGNHNIAISNEAGETLGYVEVAINNSGTLTDIPINEEGSKEEPVNDDDKPTTNEPVSETDKNEASEFNINSDKITGGLMGFICTEDKSKTNNGQVSCDDAADLKSFNGTLIGDKLIVTNIGEDSLSTAVVATKVNEFLYKGKYKGQSYYFEGRAGDGHQEKLTLEFCNKYNLSCGN